MFERVAYREAAIREDVCETRAQATFHVRHRSPLGLAFAAILVVAALGAAITARHALENRVLAVMAFVMPTMLLSFAFYLSVLHASEVEITVAQTELPQEALVSLRRRWGLLPWASPLVFSTQRLPVLETRWEAGQFSSKHGPRRNFKRASLVLKIGDVEISLPALGNARHEEREEVVFEHSQIVIDARARYEMEIFALRRGQNYARIDNKVTSKRIHKSDKMDCFRGGPVSPSLIGCSEGASDRTTLLGVAVALGIPSALAAAAYLLPDSLSASLCRALVLPAFGTLIALAIVAMTYGQTLHFQRHGANTITLFRVPDPYLFGAFRFGPRTSHNEQRLDRNFSFRIRKTLIGEDETVSFVLIDVATGQTLWSAPEEDVVRRYARKLGGREAEVDDAA